MQSEHKVIVGIVLATVLVFLGGLWFTGRGSEAEREKLAKAPLGEKMPDMGQTHVARGEAHEAYNSNPPTSGPHYGDGVAGPGIKSEPVADELVLHSMEHGAAVMWYRADMESADVDRLKEIFARASGKKIMLPRTTMETPLALASWNYLLKLNTIDEQQIIAFIETNNDRAPEKAPI